jgi:hypothetical protein
MRSYKVERHCGRPGKLISAWEDGRFAGMVVLHRKRDFARMTRLLYNGDCYLALDSQWFRVRFPDIAKRYSGRIDWGDEP